MDRPVDKPSRGWRRILLGAALVSTIGVLALVLPSVGRWLGAERSVDASRLRLGNVSRGTLVRDLSIQGRVVAAFHPTCFSPTEGIVTLDVRAGDVVEKGQVLARVNSPSHASRLLQEESTLESLSAAWKRERIEAERARLTDLQTVDLAQLALEAAKRGMRRAEESRSAGIINNVEYELAEDTLRRAELEVRHAEHAASLNKNTLDFEVENRAREVERQQLVVDEWQRRVSELTVRAPVSGRVSRVDASDRDSVAPGQSLVSVVDLSAFEIEVMIPEGYVGELAQGMPAEIRREGSTYPGELRSISPEVQGGRVRGIVAFTDDAPGGLRQNQRISARVVLEEKENVLKVGRGPFLEASGGRRAYVVRGDFAEAQEIRVGATSVEEVEIISGLAVGDRIVLSDTSRFESAERVFLRR